jgi:hypothetical protein
MKDEIMFCRRACNDQFTTVKAALDKADANSCEGIWI